MPHESMKTTLEEDREAHFKYALEQTGGEVTYHVELFLNPQKERELLQDVMEYVWQSNYGKPAPKIKGPLPRAMQLPKKP